MMNEVCRVCGGPLSEATLTAHGQTSHYCPECHNWTPEPLGVWSPVNPPVQSRVREKPKKGEPLY